MTSIFKYLVLAVVLALGACADGGASVVEPAAAAPLPVTAPLLRTQVASGFPDGEVAVRVFDQYAIRGYGGMCSDQTWNGRLVYVCTTRAYLDPRSFGEQLIAVRQPDGFCGLVAPVYLVGPHPGGCGQRMVVTGLSWGYGFSSGYGYHDAPWWHHRDQHGYRWRH